MAWTRPAPRRHLHLAAAVALLAGMGFGNVPAGQAAGGSCAAEGSRVTAKAGQARVFVTRTGTVYVCRPNARRRLGVLPEEGDSAICPGAFVRLVSVTPRYVAWSKQDDCDDRVNWTISITRIAQRATARSYPTGAGCETGCGHIPTGAVGPVTRIALTKRGDLAWSAQDQFARNFFEITKIIDGRPVRLARATDIAPRSIRWERQRLIWTQAGTTRTG